MSRRKKEKLIPTLNNGGCPFIVRLFDEKYVTIFKQTQRLRVMEVFEGSDENSAVLLRLKGNKYVFVGTEIYEFETDEKITEFYSMIGNSAVPYPVAVGEKRAYFMLDKLSIEKQHFGEDIDWNDAYGDFYELFECEHRLTHCEFCGDGDRMETDERTEEFQNIVVMESNPF